MNNGPENGTGESTPSSVGSTPAPSTPAVTARAAVPAAAQTPPFRPPLDRGIPKLGRGIVWSDLVREMEEEHAARLARWAAEDEATQKSAQKSAQKSGRQAGRRTERVVPLRPGSRVADDPAEGIEEAA